MGLNHRQRALAEAARIHRQSSGPSAPFNALVDALERAYRAEDRIERLKADLEACIAMGER